MGAVAGRGFKKRLFASGGPGHRYWTAPRPGPGIAGSGLWRTGAAAGDIAGNRVLFFRRQPTIHLPTTKGLVSSPAASITPAVALQGLRLLCQHSALKAGSSISVLPRNRHAEAAGSVWTLGELLWPVRLSFGLCLTISRGGKHLKLALRPGSRTPRLTKQKKISY